MSEFVAVGQNVQAKMEGEDLILKIHAPTLLGDSKSGKMTAIANTNGFTRLPFQVAGKDISLNLYAGVKK